MELGFPSLIIGDFNYINRPQEEGGGPFSNNIGAWEFRDSSVRMVMWTLVTQCQDLLTATTSRTVLEFGKALIEPLL